MPRLACLVLSLLAAPALAVTVTDVRVTGHRRVDPDAVLDAIRTHAGGPLDRDTVRRDLKTLWGRRLFDDVRAEVDAGGVVTIAVRERPAVRAIRFVGNDAIGADDLRKALQTSPFATVDPDTLARDVRGLRALFVDKGFAFAEVASRLEAVGDGETDVVFDICEHGKVEVRRIAFTGLSALSERELKAAMATTEGSLLSFLTGAGTFRDEVLQRDLLVLRQVCFDHGLLAASIGAPRVDVSADRRSLDVTIPVDEGAPYTVGTLEVSGDVAGLDRSVALAPGARFSSRTLQEAMGALASRLQEAGYAHATVVPRTALDVQAHTIDLALECRPGPLTTVERVEVTGNRLTSDTVLRRELSLGEGDRFSGSAVQAARARIQATGLFESVEVSTRDGSSDALIILEIRVKEKDVRSVSGGVGYGATGLSGSLNGAHHNLLGRAIDGTASVQWGSGLHLFQLGLFDPHAFDTELTLGLELHRSWVVSGALFDRLGTGGSMTLGHRILSDLQGFLTYTHEDVTVTPGPAQQVLLANRFSSGLTSSLRATLQWDRRNDRLLPTAGFLLGGSAELAAPWLGSQNVFGRLTANARGYLPLGHGVVARGNLTLGLVGSPENRALPVSELFFEGGSSSLRGFAPRSVSPRVDAGTSPGLPLSPVAVGGTSKLVANLELEFPLIPDSPLRGVVFVDAGNVWGDGHGPFETSADGGPAVLVSAGAGVRLQSPMGPLRFEVGVPLTRRPGDETWRFDFSIGTSF